MITRIVILSAVAVGLAAADPNPGRATAGWVAASANARPGQPLQTAIRIRHDDGWHSYWLNPGEAGMPTTVEWKLPPGWKVGELKFPVPIRFLTGELAGYGYEGTLLLPVSLMPPEDFAGKAELKVEVSWLACSDEGCVPGSAGLTLEITAGDATDGPHAGKIQAAIARIPRPAGDALRLLVEEGEKSLTLTLHAAEPAPLDIAKCLVFPLTPDLLDPKAEIRFSRKVDGWTAAVPMSEFASSPVRELALVLADGKKPPLEVLWRANSDD